MNAHTELMDMLARDPRRRIYRELRACELKLEKATAERDQARAELAAAMAILELALANGDMTPIAKIIEGWPDVELRG